MQVTVIIESCEDCRHLGSSGAFTVRGARSICAHSDACKERVSKTKFRKEYPEYARDIYDDYWESHWIHRVLPDGLSVPEWCPLRSGSAY